jgi:putative endopeptidase
MDRKVRPGDDFAMFAFGKWYRETEIPSGRGAIGPRMEMEARNDARIAAVIEASARDPRNGEERLIASLYDSYMNVARVEQVDAAPLERDLAAIRQLKDRRAIARHMGVALGDFGQSLFNVSIGADYDAPQRTVVRLQQPSLGAGGREIYLDDVNKARLASYQAHVARMLQLAGWREPEQLAGKIIAFETRLAQASWSRAESNDRTKTWNVMTAAELEAFAEAFPWQAFFDGAHLSGTNRFVLFEKSAFPQFATIFAETPLPTLRAWLAFMQPTLLRRISQAVFAMPISPFAAELRIRAAGREMPSTS